MKLAMLHRQPAWLIWIGCATLSTALTLVVYLMIVVPVHEQRRASAELASTLRTRQSQVQRLEADLLGLQTALTRSRASLAAQPLELGDRRELNRRIAALIHAAQSQGLEVLQLQPGRLETGEHYDRTELRFEASATLHEHLAMLERLHTDYPDMSVSALDIGGAVRAANPRPKITMQLVWYTRVGADEPPTTRSAAAD